MKNEEFVMRHHCAAKFFILSHLFKLLFAERRLHNHSFQLTSPHVNADFRTDLAVFGSDIPHSDTNLTGRRHSSGGNHTDGNTVCTIQLVTMTGIPRSIISNPTNLRVVPSAFCFPASGDW